MKYSGLWDSGTDLCFLENKIFTEKSGPRQYSTVQVYKTGYRNTGVQNNKMIQLGR